MNCLKVERIVHLYVDGELPEADADELQKHLAVCPSCDELFRQHQRTGFLLQQFYDALELPSATADKVLERAASGSRVTVPAHGSRTGPSWFHGARQMAECVIDLAAARVDVLRVIPRVYWLAAAACALFVTFLVVRAFTPASQAVFAAKIRLIRAPVMRQFPGADTWRELVSSGYLLPGGALRVGQDGMAEIIMPSGAEILLGENTSFRLNSTENKRVVSATQEQGRVYFKTVNDPLAFELNTPAGSVLGVGATATVELLPARPLPRGFGPEETSWLPPFHRVPTFLPLADAESPAMTEMVVTVMQGKVIARNAMGHVRVSPGMSVSIKAGMIPDNPRKADLSKAFAWTRVEPASPQVTIARILNGTGSGNTVSIGAGVSKNDRGSGERSQAPSSRATKQRMPSLEPPIMFEPVIQFGRVIISWTDAINTTYPAGGYDVYRKKDERSARFIRLNELPIPVQRMDRGTTGGTFEDDTIEGNTRYIYTVKALALPGLRKGQSPAVERREGALESPFAHPVTVTTLSAFRLIFTGWTDEPVLKAQIVVQKWHRGRPVSERFFVPVGHEVGGKRIVQLAGDPTSIGLSQAEEIDFSTGFVLEALLPGRENASAANASDVQVRPTKRAILRGPGGEKVELLLQH